MTETYTVKDRWGYWWSSTASPEEGYVCHMKLFDRKTVELRTLDHIIQNYGISSVAAVQEVIEDDEVIMAWADDVIVRRDLKAAPKKDKPEPVERGEDPSVFDAEVTMENLLRAIEDELYEQEGVRFRLGEKAIHEFAEKVWDAGFEQAADLAGECCGCNVFSKADDNGITNPFEEGHESDG